MRWFPKFVGQINEMCRLVRPYHGIKMIPIENVWIAKQPDYCRNMTSYAE